jgi:transcriptional regulator with GAF, ATPase, and Fis domain
MVVVTRKENEGLLYPQQARMEPRVGLLVVYSLSSPQYCFFPWRGESLYVGRDELIAAGIADEYTSKRHLRVDWNGDQLTVRDERSTNGTFLNGEALRAPAVAAPPAVLRIGRTLFLCVNDTVNPMDAGVRVDAGVVAGPKMQALFRQIDLIAASGESLLVIGESGAGKELAVKRYHHGFAGPGAPFVAVNCATIPRELAERLLFGARRGAFSGAVADADGYIQAAHGGTLFLDEIIELELCNQTKLLRVLETRLVQALGANRPQRVELRLCAAAQRDLRQEVALGKFREDLYFRIGRPALSIPPLRERLEEIPRLIELTLRRFTDHLETRLPSGLLASSGFVEACLLRLWPGNVRELQTEVRSAALRAALEGASVLGPQHLGEQAGLRMSPLPAPPQAQPPGMAAGQREEAPPASDEAQRCEAALRQEHGNINRAAQELGVTRSKLRRLIKRHKLDVARLRQMTK